MSQDPGQRYQNNGKSRSTLVVVATYWKTYQEQTSQRVATTRMHTSIHDNRT
jgi:hypothetical protein